MLPSIPSITIYYHLCIYFLEYLNVFHNRCGVSAMFLSIGHDDPECPFFLTYLTASTLLCKKNPGWKSPLNVSSNMGGTQIPDLNWYFNGKIIESSDGFWIIPANSDDLIRKIPNRAAQGWNQCELRLNGSLLNPPRYIQIYHISIR